MANIPRYCAVKLGEEEADYLHPKLEVVLKETFGVIIYQEQVMQIAQILSGYSLGEADMLRRAMGKKIKAEMDAQRDRFVTGAVEGRHPGPSRPTEIFDLLAKFADYGFNKSHAAAYALIAYQTAWFKANYPVDFLAASMTLDKGNTDKLSEFANEARRLGIALEPPSVVRGGVDFGVRPVEGAMENGGAGPGTKPSLAILYALSAIKGVGDGQAQGIVAARGGGAFRDLGDFASRLSPRDINKRVLESLVCAGAFDEPRSRAREGVRRHRNAAGGGQRAAPTSARRGSPRCSASDTADTLALPKVSGWPFTGRAVAARVQRRRLLPFRAPARRLRRRAEARMRRRAMGGFRAAQVKAGHRGRASRRHRARPRRATHALRLEDGHRPAFGPVRPVRGHPVPGGA